MKQEHQEAYVREFLRSMEEKLGLVKSILDTIRGASNIEADLIRKKLVRRMVSIAADDAEDAVFDLKESEKDQT